MYPEAIGAFVAEMDFGTAPPVTAALHAAVDAAGFGYLPPARSTRWRRPARPGSRDRYGWAVDPIDVHPAARRRRRAAGWRSSTSPRPGTPVVLPTPAYMPFLCVPAAARPGDDRGADGPPNGRRYDLDALAAAFEAGGDLLILCNPHNPLGPGAHRARSMLAIADVVRPARRAGVLRRDPRAAGVPGARHVPYASLSPVTAGHTLTATSASKAWNLPGLKCAQVMLTSDADRETWAGIGPLAEHGASTLGVLANTAAYESGGPWLDDVLAYLDGNRRLLGELLAEHLPGVGYTPPRAPTSAWLDFRATGPADPAPYFLEKAGVAMTDGALCGEAGRGFGRFNFALPGRCCARRSSGSPRRCPDGLRGSRRGTAHPDARA